MKKPTTRKFGDAKIVSFGATASACYIYGILDLGQKIVLKSKSLGTSGSKIYAIPFEDISALVSRSEYVQYDPSEKNLMLHNNALQEARASYHCAILPLRFSTVAKSENDVMKILVNGHSKFKQKLAYLRGKLEIAVKVYCKIDELERNIADGKSQKDSKVDRNDALKQESFKLANDLLHRLESLSIKYQLSDLIFDDMIMNAAFLVDEKKVKPFVEGLKSYDNIHGKYLKIHTSGPYVAYSFTEPVDASGQET